jgi:hypothetical protein
MDPTAAAGCPDMPPARAEAVVGVKVVAARDARAANVMIDVCVVVFISI